MIYIGIDPGVSGGIAVLRDDGMAVFASAQAWPHNDSEMYGIHTIIRDSAHQGVRHCAIERVWASPQMGVVSAFTFGGAYHSARTLAILSRWHLVEPTPQQWQKAMSCLTRGDKTITKRLATEMFPDIKVVNATADALLLAAYCRRVALGEIEGPINNGKESSRKKQASVRRRA